MKTKNRLSRGAAGVKNETPQQHMMSLADFDELAGCVQVEHQTVPGFLRRIPHKWHMNEIDRFGGQVGRAAEALHLVYMTAVDKSLGVLRVFPLPLMQRVYELMAPQFGWPPQLVALENGEDGAREKEIRRNEGTKRHLSDAAKHAPAEVAEHFRAVMKWLDSETAKLKATEQSIPPTAPNTPPQPPPLRAL